LIQAQIFAANASSVTSNDKIKSPDTDNISTEEHGEVEMNVWVLQLVENVTEVSQEQENVHHLCQNNVSTFFAEKPGTSENLESPDSKSTPNNEVIAKFDCLMQVWLCHILNYYNVK